MCKKIYDGLKKEWKERERGLLSLAYFFQFLLT
jgi:hypothetical protein